MQQLFIQRGFKDTRNDDNAPVTKQLLTLFMCQFDFVENNPELARIMFRESMFPDQNTAEQRNQVDI